MDKKIIIILYGAVSIGLLIGFAIGMFIQIQKYSPDIAKLKILEPTIKYLSSKVVPSILIYGQVVNVDGRNITLEFQKEQLVVEIKTDAKIYSYQKPVDGSKTAQGQTESNFIEIKKGDSLNVTGQVLGDGKLVGKSVIILNKINN